MTLTEFRRLLDVHGSDPAGWPVHLRDGAEALRRGNPAAHAEWLSACRLDALVANEVRDIAAADTARGGLPIPPSLPPQRRGLWHHWMAALLLDAGFAPAWGRIAVLGSLAVIGFAAGLAPLPFERKGTMTVVAHAQTLESEFDVILFDADPVTSVRP